MAIQQENYRISNILHYNIQAFIGAYSRWCACNEGPIFYDGLSPAIEWLHFSINDKRVVVCVGEQMSSFIRHKLEEIPDEMDIILIVSSEYEFGVGLDSDDELITAIVHGCTEKYVYDLFSIEYIL